MKRFLSILLPFIGLAIFVAIVLTTGPARILDALRAMDAMKLLAIPPLMFVIVLLRGIRWSYLMRVIGIDYGVTRSTVVWIIGFFASAVTPGKVGDAVRAFYVTDETDASFGEAFLTVFIDRLWDLVLVLAAGVVTVLLFSHYYTAIPSTWILLLSAAGLGFVIYLATNRRFMRRALRPLFNLLVPDRHHERMSMSFHTFYDSLGVYFRGWRQLVGIGLLTVAYWALVFLMAYYVSVILGLDVDPLYIVLIMPIVTLVELVPISISGLGTREATVIYFFSLVGVSSAQAVGFSIAYLIIGTYLTSLVGFLFWLRSPVRLGDRDGT